MECKICKKQFDNNHIQSLSYHLNKYHPKINHQLYYDKYINLTINKRCPICGKERKFNNISKGYFDTCGNKDCIKKNIVNSVKKSNLKKYGVENVYQRKEIINKIKEVKKERYGNENYNNSKKISDSVREHYINNPEIKLIKKKKQKETFLRNYGVDNPWKNKDVIQKRLNTFNKKSKDEKDKIKEKKRIKEFRKSYNKILKYEKVKPLFTIDEYNGCLDNYKWKCKECDNIFIHDLKSFPRCLKCYPLIKGYSNIEIEVRNWIKKFINIKENKRFMYENKKWYEIDIYIPEKNFGIEVDGIYWHSELNGKDKYYHINKTNFFKDRNINLIHVFDNEWIEKQDVIKSIILYKLGLINNKIYARKCKIKELDINISREFIDKNHLQGYVNSSIKLGLFYEEELVSIMTFGKSRFNKNYDYELLRFCSILNTNVIGAFSKLLNYFIKIYKFKKLITYADKRFSNGNVYLKNGFKFINNSSPNYYYIKDKKLESRIKYQKHKLKNILDKYNEELTEWDNMQVNGYDRIWDCGNMVFEYNF